MFRQYNNQLDCVILAVQRRRVIYTQQMWLMNNLPLVIKVEPPTFLPRVPQQVRYVEVRAS